jgi:hypothetical protein
MCVVFFFELGFLFSKVKIFEDEGFLLRDAKGDDLLAGVAD